MSSPPWAPTATARTRSAIRPSKRSPAPPRTAAPSATLRYRIEVPDGWDGGPLVLWAHGFRGFDDELFVGSPRDSLREQLIDEGIAWAASSYSENGYVPGIGADDTLALKQHFVDEFGEPAEAYLVGASMGGNVVALSLEHFPGQYDGALSLCGALGGQTQIDYLVSWARLAEYFSGLELPVGEGASETQLFDFLLNEMAPVLGAFGEPTPEGEQFLSAIRMLTGGPRPFFEEGFEDQYVTNFGFLLFDPELESLLVRAATNVGVEYDIEPGLGVTAEEINEGIVRQEADPEARNAENHPDKVPTSGDITAPLLALHTTGDLFVPITQGLFYRDAVRDSGKEDMLVQRVIRAPGHCTFSDEEILAGFDDLQRWVESGERPAGSPMDGDFTDEGFDFTNPIREGDPGAQ
ncbi:MAG: hypothetical protein U5Q44_02530 [Dehalococcoidia bacterium]|nr:hypothetical protein [Dehalococcoidia bacterium]